MLKCSNFRFRKWIIENLTVILMNPTVEIMNSREVSCKRIFRLTWQPHTCFSKTWIRNDTRLTLHCRNYQMLNLIIHKAKSRTPKLLKKIMWIVLVSEVPLLISVAIRRKQYEGVENESLGEFGVLQTCRVVGTFSRRPKLLEVVNWFRISRGTALRMEVVLTGSPQYLSKTLPCVFL